jgi:hypothetical protein
MPAAWGGFLGLFGFCSRPSGGAVLTECSLGVNLSCARDNRNEALNATTKKVSAATVGIQLGETSVHGRGTAA